MTLPPWAASASAASSAAARAKTAEVAWLSVSVTGWPAFDWTRPVPEVMMSGGPVPASAAPSVAMTFRSFSLCCFRAEGVMVEGRMDDAVGCPGGVAQCLQVVHVAAEDLRASGCQRLGARVRTAEPDHVMARAD